MLRKEQIKIIAENTLAKINRKVFDGELDMTLLVKDILVHEELMLDTMAWYYKGGIIELSQKQNPTARDVIKTVAHEFCHALQDAYEMELNHDIRFRKFADIIANALDMKRRQIK